LEQEIRQFALRLSNAHGSKIESIIQYPHPFTSGGLIIIFRDDAGLYQDLVADVQSCDPQGTTLHTLRRSELIELSLPKLAPLQINEYPHIALYAKYKGNVLFGSDLRAEIVEPKEIHLMLEATIDAYACWFRDHIILKRLAQEEYLSLIQTIHEQMRQLMAMALLRYKEWDITVDTLEERFRELYPDTQMRQVLEAFSGIRGKTEDKDGDALRSDAFESVWLFESFLRQLRRYTS
jgi:hypothetical protein